MSSPQRIHFCKLIFCCSLIFVCFQSVFALDLSPFPKDSQNVVVSPISQRHLEQITPEPSLLTTSEDSEKPIPSPDLNPGEILGSIDPGSFPFGAEGIDITISKDGKALFAVMNHTLVIYNITNPKMPTKLGSFETIYVVSTAILLSPKEDYLYILSQGYLWIINVTNKAAPSQMVSEKFYFLDGKNFPSSTDVTKDFSMAISCDGKVLYVRNRQYLRRWDVENPQLPLLMDEEVPEPNWNGSFALSKNSTRLVVGLENGFKIYNVENDRIRAILLKSVVTKGRVYSVAFSQDETKLLLGIQSTQAGRTKNFEFNLTIFDIKNLASPTLVLSRQLNNESSFGKLYFHANENYALFNTKHEMKMINIQEWEQTALFSTPFDVRALPFTASLGNKINVVYFAGIIYLLKFNIDIPQKSFLHFKPNALRVIDEADYDRRKVMEISKEGDYLYLMRLNTTEPGSGELIPYERKSNVSFEKIETSARFYASLFEDVNDEGQWMLLAGKDVALVNYVPDLGSNLFVVNNVYKEYSYIYHNKKFRLHFQRIPAIALTHDEKRVIFVNHTDDTFQKVKSLSLNIFTFDLQEFISDDTLTNFNMPYRVCSPLSLMKTNQADNLLFYVNCDLLIYNIEDPSAPILESSLDLKISQGYAFILSKDEKTLYLFGLDSTTLSYQKLIILNISNPKSPQLLSSLHLQQSASISSESTESLELNSDGTTLYIGFLGGILLVDVRTPTQPALFGFNYFLDEMYTPRFTENANVLYTSSYKGVTAYDFSSQYILYFKNSEFQIGASYSISLMAFKLNKNLKFDFMMKKHKFLKVALFEQTSTSSIALPNWMTFEKERSLLKIEPHSPSHNGTYKISAILTTQTQPSAFIGLDLIKNVSDAKELMLSLIQSGYIDNQGYISGDFDINQELFIHSKYQAIEKEIRAILSKSYIQAIGEISVISSLKLLETKPLKISTLSKDTVYFTIQLDQNQRTIPRFSTKSHSILKPLIDNKKSLLRLEGLLENVNEALREIVVDLNGLQTCHGEINIIDGINPPLSLRIPSLSNYLYVNEKPIINLDNLQDQIDSSPFYTGLYSSCDINASTFIDINNLTLEYALELEDAKLGLPPAWIALKGLTLMATPPESYRKFSYKFVLRVSNEFQNITVPFTLKVRFSFTYAAKLAATFLGYAVSLIGFIYSMNKGFNIVAKKYYRHPRSFKLKVGQEICDTNLFPISFIPSEVVKSKNLFKALEKHVTQNHRCSLLEYFVDSHSQILDQQKIIDTLEIINGGGSSSEKYSFSHRTTNQLIINLLITKQLNTRQETKTRQIFNDIKTKWMDLVISSPSAAQFIINSENLNKELLNFTGGENLNETHFESSGSLLGKNSFNIELLASAIIAHAFSHQNLDVDLILIDVISYKQTKGDTFYHRIKELLLRNLKPFVFLNKREIGCGIEYKIDENTLHFSGRLTHELKNDTIVIHLKNNRGRILKEFWIVGDNPAIQSHLENISETL